ncbi:MAG: type 4a pilus biogenesis protein PilO [Luminiphilus sp.]|nr:type 4a pilus biogenesis protein PilO [Luminiphilus sp.]
MSILDQIRALNEVDLANLDFENVGSWPGPLRVLLAILLFLLLAAGGYFYHLDGLNQRFASEQATEVELRREFERVSFEAANLDAYRVQMREMRESFGALVSQLPSDTEVPGLLEDISAKGQQNGMSIDNIDLLDEVTEEFYVELPIAIRATGSYHNLGAFVSGMAGLPRIVTLHDFDIVMIGDDSAELVMEITAKTYRYRDGANDG